MNFFAGERFYKWWKLSWFLCVITLPWIDVANNISLIFITILWFCEMNFIKRFSEIKNANWAWPLFIYYLILIIGSLYTSDVDNALFTLDKKISFVALPLFAITGLPLDKKFTGFLKISFVYSCFAIVLLCFTMTTVNFLTGGSTTNFDIFSTNNYNTLHPNAAVAWMHFSYIQLSHWAVLHPGYFSMYLGFSVIILLTEKFDSKLIRAFHFIVAIVIVAFIALLSSRMAIVAFLMSTIFLIVMKIIERQVIIITTIMLLIFVVGFFLAFNPVSKFRMVEEPLTTNYQADTSVTRWNSVSLRLLEWQGTWSVIRSHLFLGVGTGGGTSALMNFYSHFNKSTVDLESNAHNQFLQTWMELGVAGLLTFVLCLIGPLISTQSYSNTQYVCFLIIFIMMCLTESVVERQKGVVFFTLFQTLFLGFERKAK